MRALEPSPVPDSPLLARWLAEAVCQREARAGVLDDPAIHAAARAAATDFEARVIHRAAALGARNGMRDALLRWHGRARVVLAVALMLALVLGFGAAVGVLGDGSRPVNVVWALGGLLGLHLLSLLLWLAGMAFGNALRGTGVASGGWLGRTWLRVVGALDRSPAAAELPQALVVLLGRGRLAAWGLGIATHALWLAALAGATLGVLLLLALRRYGFVWETTILPAQGFVALSALLGALPALLGFPVPDPAVVVASGSAPLLDEVSRRAWAGWLLGALLVYGVVPRLLLLGVCVAGWRRGVGRHALDLSRPAYARLHPLLQPDSERLGVSDAAPALMPRPQRHGVAAGSAADAVAVALELGDDLAWPPPWLDPARSGARCDGGRLDTREQRRDGLQRLAAHPPARLLIAIDARQTPDRGSLGLIATLADHAAAVAVWALDGGTGAGANRLSQWQAGLAALGLPHAVLTDAVAARVWFEHGGGV